ncbi:hypothetical protein PHMEG_0002074 [Phytophthora megakarya]|uniref:Uncharacterized protein n=1 Tax=Phytophthora megakarya TaxID=4795 RepID=A0A225WZ65_9STRA|nr:hypothetical protein PHMEG_0002074 [Phytophthora megakarya]
MSSYEVISSLEGHESEVKSVAWSPSGAYLATCSRDKSVWIWEADADTDFECISVLHGHSQDVKFVAWHPTEDLLVSASYDDTIRTWAENDDDWYCKETLTGHSSTVWGVALSPQGSEMASVSDDTDVIVWQYDPSSKDTNEDGSPKQWKQKFTLSNCHERTIFSVDWSKHGDLLVTGAADNGIRVFQGQPTGTPTSFNLVVNQHQAHASDINCVRWSPNLLESDNRKTLLLASAGDDACVRIWNMASADPEELQGEPRWSSIRYAPHPHPAQWSRATDEKLLLLVTQSTASGERFPVGVNWLEVSRVVRRSPVDCVKRYAFLHEARECYSAMEGDQVEGKQEEGRELEEELEGALLTSEDEYLEDQTSLSDFATPVASPKLQSLDTSGEFVRSGPTSPGSPPPFAVARPAPRQTGTTVSAGLFRWENLVNDPNYTAPVLNSPPSLRHKQSFQGRFGLEDDEAKVLSPRRSPQGPMSPSGAQIGEMGADPNYSASVLTHAFKGLKLGAIPLSSPPLGSPLIGSPRLSRKISNSEYPFLKEEDMSARQSGASSATSSFRVGRAAGAPILNDAYGSGDPTAGDLQRQMNAHLMRMSAMSAMSSFHGDNPFSGSVTQSALEDAFLDMAGSRLDASNVLLSSRMSTAPGLQSQTTQAHEPSRPSQDAASKPME